MGFIDLVFGDRTEKTRALLDRARAYLREGRVDKAHQAAERALRLDPDGAEARETLGRIQLRLAQLAWSDGDVDDAIELYGRAHRLLSDPVLLFYRGLAYREAKQYLKAIEDFSRVMRSEELSAVPYATYAAFCRGLCYREMGEIKHAAKDFTSCLEADPGSPLRHRYLAYRAIARAALGEREEALADLREAEALGPRASEVALARTLVESEAPVTQTRRLPAPRAIEEPTTASMHEDLPEVTWQELPPERDSEPTGEPVVPPQPAPLADDERMALLRLKRDAAFASRPQVFGAVAVGARTAPTVTTTTVVEPAPEATALSPRAQRCERKLRELLGRFDDQPLLYDDVEFCVDFLLVVGRMRELDHEDKRLLAARLGELTLARLEAAEARARVPLYAMPGQAEARRIADGVTRLADGDAGADPEEIASSFESLSRPQKYLVVDLCGAARFQRFAELLEGMGSKEAHP